MSKHNGTWQKNNN